MTVNDELVHLEAERDRLQSMIDYHERSRPSPSLLEFLFVGIPFGAVAGETEIRQRLAECEVRIAELKACKSR